MTPLLTVIIPVYNEARTIGELLPRVLDTPFAKQVIVVDDGSTDGTLAKLAAWPVTVVAQPFNLGKGAAIRTGLEQARGTYTIIQDADLEYDPQDYERLLAPLLAGQADVVYGSRYMRRFQVQGSRFKVAAGCAGSGNPRTTQPLEIQSGDGSPHSKTWSVCRWGVGLLNLAVRCLYGARLTDEATCYKLFRTADLRAMDLQCEQFEFCPEVTAKACRMGLRIVEVPISYTPRSVAQGKKIRWRDGWTAMKTLWRWRHWRPSAISQDFKSRAPTSRASEVAPARNPSAEFGKNGRDGIRPAEPIIAAMRP